MTRMTTLCAAFSATILLSCTTPPSPGTPHWLSGSWTAPAFDGVLRETWEQEGSALLVKAGYYIEQSDTLYSEQVRIDSLFDGTYLLAQPKGGHPVIFRLVEKSDSAMTFRNPGNRNPFEVTYRRMSDDRFVRTTVGMEGSDTVRNRFDFTRVGSDSPTGP